MMGLELRAFVCVAHLLVVEKEEWNGWDGTRPPLPCILQEYDSMRVNWWGSAKNVILKRIVARKERAASGRRRIGERQRHGSKDPPLRRREERKTDPG